MFARFKRPIETPAKEPTLTLVPAAAASEPADDFIDLRVRLHQRLIIDEIDLTAIERMPRSQFESEVGDIIRDMLKRETVALSEDQRKRLVAEVLDELLGLGPLEPLLKDHTINDIIVTTFQQVC